MSSDGEARASRRWLLARVGVIGGALLLGGRAFRSVLDDREDEAVEPRPLAELGLGELWRTLPADADPGNVSDVIDAELDAIARQGRGGVLYLPPGEWTVARAVRILTDDVAIVGAGIRATRLRLAPGVRDHIIEVLADGVSVERLTLVGNGAAIEGEGLGHGVRAGDNAVHLLVRDVVVEDVQGYGIGLQPQLEPVGTDEVAVGGLFEHVVLRNITIVGTGLDGIDFKDYDWDTAACPRGSVEEQPATPPGCVGSRSFLRNISVTGIAQHRPLRDERGIDIRGQRLLQNIDVLEVPPTSAGVYFRRDLGGRNNGRGAQWSTLENFYISTQGPASEGLAHPDVEGVEIHNGFVVGPDEVRTLT